MANCVVCTPMAMPPAPAVEVVAGEAALPALVELPLRGEGEGVGGDDEAVEQPSA